MTVTPSTPNTPEGRYLHRVERRVTFLKMFIQAELGVYLSPDAKLRKRAVEQLVRSIARQSELPHLKPETLERATDMFMREFEAMQKILPHDVQYVNRLKQTW